MKKFYVITILLTFFISFKTFGKPSVSIKSNKIIILNSKSQIKKLIIPQNKNAIIKLNNEGTKLIYSADNWGYYIERKIDIKIMDVESFKIKKRFTIDKLNSQIREIKSLDWYNTNIILIKGVGRNNKCFLFYNLNNNKELINLWGRKLKFSPNKQLIVSCNPKPGGYIPPQYNTDFVRLAVFKEINFIKKTIYPNIKGEIRKVLTDFYWNNLNNKICFIEEINSKSYLTVLELNSNIDLKKYSRKLFSKFNYNNFISIKWISNNKVKVVLKQSTKIIEFD